MVKKLIVTILTLMMLFTLCGCGGNDETEDDPNVLRVALQTTAQGIPAYIAENEGYTEKNAVAINSSVYATGVAQLEALAAGGWDVACIGAPPAIAANISYDAKIIALVLEETSTEIFVRSDSDILTANSPVEGIKGDADAWRGKTILLPFNTTSYYIILSQLSKLGLTIDDVQLINMDVGQAYTAFKSGVGDAVCLWDPNSFRAQDEGWVSVLYGPDTEAVCPCMLVASNDAINTKPELVKAWLKSYFDVAGSSDFTTDKMANTTFEFFNNNNITISEEEAMLFAKRKHIYTIDEAYDLFFSDLDGQTPAEKYMYDIIKFFNEQGSYTDEETAKVTNGGLFYTQFVKEIFEEK